MFSNGLLTNNSTPRRNMSDEEILRKYVDLSKSDMTEEEMEEFI